MPRPMLKQKPQTQTNAILSVTPRNEKKQAQMQTNKMQLDRLLRKKRSRQYMDAIHKLDAGGHVCNQEKVNSIINAIKEEFPEVDLSGISKSMGSGLYIVFSPHTIIPILCRSCTASALLMVPMQ